MKRIELENVPDKLYELVEAQAETLGMELEEYIKHTLWLAVEEEWADIDSFLKERYGETH